MATEVDGQTLDVPVGALIDLAVKYRTGWGVLQKVEWEIPGTSKVNYVADYTNDNSTAAVTEVSAADKQKREIKFYWVDGGDGRVVKANCDYLNGTVHTSKTLTITYNVKAPTCDFTATVGTVAIGNPGFPGAGNELHFGTSAHPGIKWTGKATTPAVGAGAIKDLQLIIMDRRYTTDPGNVRRKATSNGNWELDVSNPYSSSVTIAASATGTLTSDDSPGDGLAASRKAVAANDQFRVWILYRPDQPHAIWVPLSVLEWHWKGKATKDASGTWSLVAGSAEGVATSPGVATTEFPVYS